MLVNMVLVTKPLTNKIHVEHVTIKFNNSINICYIFLYVRSKRLFFHHVRSHVACTMYLQACSVLSDLATGGSWVRLQ